MQGLGARFCTHERKSGKGFKLYRVQRGARQTVYYMNQDAVDYFRVDFTPGESIVGGKHYPLGTFAVEMMECVMVP